MNTALQAQITHLFTPRTTDGRRLRWQINAADKAKFARGQHWSAVITDQTTGRRYQVEGAECGAGPRCFCDALVVMEVM